MIVFMFSPLNSELGAHKGHVHRDKLKCNGHILSRHQMSALWFAHNLREYKAMHGRGSRIQELPRV